MTLAFGVGRRAGVLMGAAVAVSVTGSLLPWRPATLCLLRGVTGIPCPLCGSTTAAVRMAQGDVASAFAANPVTILGAIALVLAPLYASRIPRSWYAPLFTSAGVVAWVWQLARFDLIPI